VTNGSHVLIPNCLRTQFKQQGKWTSDNGQRTQGMAKTNKRHISTKETENLDINKKNKTAKRKVYGQHF